MSDKDRVEAEIKKLAAKIDELEAEAKRLKDSKKEPSRLELLDLEQLPSLRTQLTSYVQQQTVLIEKQVVGGEMKQDELKREVQEQIRAMFQGGRSMVSPPYLAPDPLWSELISSSYADVEKTASQYFAFSSPFETVAQGAPEDSLTLRLQVMKVLETLKPEYEKLIASLDKKTLQEVGQLDRFPSLLLTAFSPEHIKVHDHKKFVTGTKVADWLLTDPACDASYADVLGVGEYKIDPSKHPILGQLISYIIRTFREDPTPTKRIVNGLSLGAATLQLLRVEKAEPLLISCSPVFPLFACDPMTNLPDMKQWPTKPEEIPIGVLNLFRFLHRPPSSWPFVPKTLIKLGGKEYTKVCVLGKGATPERVWMVHPVLSPREYLAWKRVSLSDAKNLQHLEREICILRALSKPSPHVATLVDEGTDHGYRWMLTSPVGCSFWELDPLDPQTILRSGVNLIRGVNHVHSQRVLLCDVSIGNSLSSGIIDFGSGTEEDEAQHSFPDRTSPIICASQRQLKALLKTGRYTRFIRSDDIDSALQVTLLTLQDRKEVKQLAVAVHQEQDMKQRAQMVLEYRRKLMTGVYGSVLAPAMDAVSLHTDKVCGAVVESMLVSLASKSSPELLIQEAKEVLVQTISEKQDSKQSSIPPSVQTVRSVITIMLLSMGCVHAEGKNHHGAEAQHYSQAAAARCSVEVKEAQIQGTTHCGVTPLRDASTDRTQQQR